MTSPATETIAIRTPILTREALLPPRTPLGSGLAVVLTIWLCAVVIVAACWLLNRPPILRQWFLTDIRPWFLDHWVEIGIVGFGVFALTAFYLMLATHELGHVVAGLCAGFRCRSLRVGPLLFGRPFRVSLYRSYFFFTAGWRKSRSTLSFGSVETGPSRQSHRIISGMIAPPNFWPCRFMPQE